MRFWPFKTCLCFAVFMFMILAPRHYSEAQGSAGTIQGTVTDPSGGVVAGTTIVVTSADGQSFGATTTRDGLYEVKNLAPGIYKFEAIAQGFALYEKDGVEVKAGQTLKLDVRLAIQAEQEKVTVSAEAPTVDVSPENNAGSVVISGKALDALSDDPDELQSDLQALAGPSAGPNGGQMYIDGFTAGQLPPKSSIREIRINQNPFSSEYDKLGYGRIEIFTKPGTDKFHGQFEVMGNDSALNSENPFESRAGARAISKLMYNGSIGGPLSKKASFFVSAQRRDINDLGIVNPGAVLDSNNNIVTNFNETVPNNMTRTNVGPRLDYQLTKNNTLTVRYQYWRNNETNQALNGFSLPSQGYNALSSEQTLQLSDTQMFGTKVVNENLIPVPARHQQPGAPRHASRHKRPGRVQRRRQRRGELRGHAEPLRSPELHFVAAGEPLPEIWACVRVKRRTTTIRRVGLTARTRFRPRPPHRRSCFTRPPSRPSRWGIRYRLQITPVNSRSRRSQRPARRRSGSGCLTRAYTSKMIGV